MDTFFNQRYADQITKMVSSMDDDEAAMFTLLVTHDVLHRHIDDNRNTVDRYATEVVKRVNGHAREVISKMAPPEQKLALRLIEEVEKASKKSKYADWNWERQGDPPYVTRRKGRFAPKGSTVRVTAGGKTHTLYQDKKKSAIDVTQTFSARGRDISTFEQEWNKGVDPYNPNSRTYNRVQQGSKVLAAAGSVASAAGAPVAGGAMSLAGEFGQFAGQFGPEAEKVVGPSIRRTTYRYRGTERKLDPELGKLFREEAAQFRRNNDDVPVEALRTPEVRQQVAERAAIRYLDKTLPEKSLALLQRNSGRIPPSQGILINADGEVITQAVGYQEDHYLPFNLRNLKGLQGGSYVRTRSSGGLTSEDIYTGLLAGARSVTVVSRSGVFTLEFEDDFRGQRRYSDKARQMVRRYEKTLDAVQSRTIRRIPLSAEEKIQIREETESEMEELKGSFEGRRQIEEEIRRREQMYQSATHLTTQELEEVNQKAFAAAQDPNIRSVMSMGDRSDYRKPTQLPGDVQGRFRILRAQMIDDTLAEKQSKILQLDGEGYATSMRALREQYPYFIKDVRSKTEIEGRPLSFEQDKGYVESGAIRPAGAKEGWYGDPKKFSEERPMGGKIAANRMHHQVSRPEAESGHVSTNTSKPAEGAPGAPKSTGRSSSSVRSKIERAQMARKADEALVDAIEHHLPLVASEKGFENLKRFESLSSQHSTDPAAFRQSALKLLSSPTTREKVIADIRSVNSRLTGDASAKEASSKRITEFMLLESRTGGEEFDQATFLERGSSPAKPYTFEKTVKVGLKPAEYASQFGNAHRSLAPLSTIHGKVPDDISKASDDELRKTSTTALALGQLYRRISDKDMLDETEIVRQMGNIFGSDLDRAQTETTKAIAATNNLSTARSRAEVYERAASTIERMRALKSEHEKVVTAAGSTSDNKLRSSGGEAISRGSSTPTTGFGPTRTKTKLGRGTQELIDNDRESLDGFWKEARDMEARLSLGEASDKDQNSLRTVLKELRNHGTISKEALGQFDDPLVAMELEDLMQKYDYDPFDD